MVKAWIEYCFYVLNMSTMICVLTSHVCKVGECFLKRDPKNEISETILGEMNRSPTLFIRRRCEHSPTRLLYVKYELT